MNALVVFPASIRDFAPQARGKTAGFDRDEARESLRHWLQMLLLVLLLARLLARRPKPIYS